MSTYQDALPINPALSPYIETYRLIRGKKPLHAKEVLPRPGATLFFDMQGMRFNGKEEVLRTPLIGFSTYPIHCATITEDRTCFVIKFNAYGLSRFISTSVDKFTNRVIDAATIFGAGIEELYASLQTATKLVEWIQLTETFLSSRLIEPDDITREIFRLAERLRRMDEPVRLAAERKQVPLGARQLERRFKDLVGTDMTTYMRICRFDHAQSLLYTQEALSLSQVGYEAGYFDPAHFSRDFKKLAGTRPGG
jgi:AraC-like DNA-binding protein